MIPCAGVVSRPSGGIALASSVAGSGQDKGALVGGELAETFEGASGVLHPEDVVDLKVVGDAFFETGLVDAVPGLVGHGLRGDFKERRLIHVVPKAGDALADEVRV